MADEIPFNVDPAVLQQAEHSNDTVATKKVSLYATESTTKKRLTATTSGSKVGLDTYPIEGLEIPAHDYIALTYVAAGNGVGEIETVTFKDGGSGGTTVATLTLAYNASHKISSVTRT